MNKHNDSELRLKYDTLIAELALMTNRNKRGFIIKPILGGFRYHEQDDRRLAAVHMAFTKQCTLAQAGRLHGTTSTNIKTAVDRAGRILAYDESIRWYENIVVHTGDTAEMAKLALSLESLAEDEIQLRSELQLAIENPDDWVVVVATHPDDASYSEVSVTSVAAPQRLGRKTSESRLSSKTQQVVDELVSAKLGQHMLRWSIQLLRTGAPSALEEYKRVLHLKLRAQFHKDSRRLNAHFEELTVIWGALNTEDRQRLEEYASEVLSDYFYEGVLRWLPPEYDPSTQE